MHKGWGDGSIVTLSIANGPDKPIMLRSIYALILQDPRIVD